MKISVKQKHIEEAKERFKHECEAETFVRSENCPIALALTDALGKKCNAFCEKFKIGSGPILPLPKSAIKFISAFDAGRKVKPFNFVIKGDARG